MAEIGKSIKLRFTFKNMPNIKKTVALYSTKTCVESLKDANIKFYMRIYYLQATNKCFLNNIIMSNQKLKF